MKNSFIRIFIRKAIRLRGEWLFFLVSILFRYWNLRFGFSGLSGIGDKGMEADKNHFYFLS